MSINLDSEKIKSIILGHAIGDSLGVPVEFSSRSELAENPVTDMVGFGTYPVPAGSWSDDTSMTLCALESLSKGFLNPDEIMTNFVKWLFHNEFTPTGKTFDVGMTCHAAINNYFSKHTDPLRCGLSDERSNGNGSLMRIIPFALFSIAVNGNDNPGKLWETVSAGSALTHAHERSLLACEIYASVLLRLIENPSKDAVTEGIELCKQENLFSNPEYIHYRRIDADFLRSLDCSDINSSGYVVDSLEAALWCLLTTESFSECVLKAVNLGDDTDSVAAIAGGLAGALYGLEGIPGKWLNTLQKKDFIESLCVQAAENWQKIS